MTNEERISLVNELSPKIAALHTASIGAFDSTINTSGLSIDDFLTVMVTVHPKTGGVFLGANLAREDALRLLAEVITSAIAGMIEQAKLKALEN